MNFTIEQMHHGILVHTKSRACEERNIGVNTLCSSCRFGQIMRRKGDLNAVVFCAAVNAFVPPDIAECSRYANMNAMDMREMELLALPVDGRVAVQDGSYR